MNVTEAIRAELRQAVPTSPQDVRAFLAAVTKGIGTLGIFRNGFRVEYECKDEQTAWLLAGLLRSTYDVPVEYTFSSGQPRTCVCTIGTEHAAQVLEQMGLTAYGAEGELQLAEGLPALEHVTNREVARAYIQGVFLVCGGCYAPDDVETRGGYHLEMVVSDRTFAEQLVRLLGQIGMKFHLTERGGNWSVYSKSGEQIADFLAFLQTMNGVMELNDIMIRRQINNDINRRSNIYIANLDKTSLANTRYVRAAAKVLEAGACKDEKLLHIATERLRDREESMRALASRLGMSTTSLSRALHKLVRLAGMEEE